MDQNTRQIHKVGPPYMCSQHNVRAPPEPHRTENKTKDTHPIPGYELQFLTPPGIEHGSPGWKARTLLTTPRLFICWLFCGKYLVNYLLIYMVNSNVLFQN